MKRLTGRHHKTDRGGQGCVAGRCGIRFTRLVATAPLQLRRCLYSAARRGGSRDRTALYELLRRPPRGEAALAVAVGGAGRGRQTGNVRTCPEDPEAEGWRDDPDGLWSVRQLGLQQRALRALSGKFTDDGARRREGRVA